MRNERVKLRVPSAEEGYVSKIFFAKNTGAILRNKSVLAKFWRRKNFKIVNLLV